VDMDVFVQIEDPEERVIVVRGAPSEEAVRARLPPGRAWATEAGEYLSYWNDDHCYYAGAEQRRAAIEEVAALRDPSFKDVPWAGFTP
jgi:hypothetical protein